MTYDDLQIISPGCHCQTFGYNYIFLGERFVEESGKFYSIYSFQKVNLTFDFVLYEKFIELKFSIYNKNIGLDLRTNYNKGQLEILNAIEISSALKMARLKDKFKTNPRYIGFMKQFEGTRK